MHVYVGILPVAEDVVVLYYVGHYTCVANPGYTCDKDSNTTFISADITDGVYTLTADGDAGVLCKAAYSEKCCYFYWCKYDSTVYISVMLISLKLFYYSGYS